MLIYFQIQHSDDEVEITRDVKNKRCDICCYCSLRPNKFGTELSIFTCLTFAGCCCWMASNACSGKTQSRGQTKSIGERAWNDQSSERRRKKFAALITIRALAHLSLDAAVQI